MNYPDRRGKADVAFPNYSLSETFTTLPSLSPTLYAVLQEFRAWLLSLLSESNQGERFIERQFAQESVGGVDMLSNLKRTTTI